MHTDFLYVGMLCCIFYARPTLTTRTMCVASIAMAMSAMPALATIIWVFVPL